LALIQNLLIRDEAYRRSVYLDSMGYWTLGIGRLVDARKGGGISKSEALFLLENDIREREALILYYLPWYPTLNEVRRAVLLSMSFQLGVDGLLLFRNTLKAVKESRYDAAADGMMQSLWARQVPLRASRLAQAMRSGEVSALELDEDPPQP
jgi:lysozyme